MKKLAAVLLLAVLALGLTASVKAATTSCCDSAECCASCNGCEK